MKILKKIVFIRIFLKLEKRGLNPKPVTEIVASHY
jgi:hypothetical protein